MNIFLTLWYKIVGEPSFAKAVSTFEKAKNKLETAIEHQLAKSQKFASIKAEAEKAEAWAKAEADKAKNAFKKFEDLLS